MSKSWQNFWQGLFKKGELSLVATFPFTQKPSKNLGSVYQPLISVKAWSPWLNRWLTMPMIVDTGADYTILPKFLALQLGIDLKKDCQPMQTVGVGGETAIYFYPNLAVKLGKAKREIPVGFANTNDIPALMGRQAFLETFVTTFYQTKQIFFYQSKDR